MKHLLQGTIAVLLIATASCKDAPKADEAKTTEAQTVETTTNGTGYNVDLQKSHIDWIGTKPTGRHHGIVLLKAGTIAVTGENVQSGTFVADIAGLTAFDDDNSANEKLQGHLKSADFFDVAQYPTATFEITAVQPGVTDKDVVMKDATHTVTGNLKMKDITKSITIPAKITVANGMLVAHSEFNLDRTLWGINYKSDKSLGDKMINSDINFVVHIEASNK